MAGSAPRDPFGRWLAAVALGGRGQYAAAAAHLGLLISGRDPVIAALAAATRASHLRQVGGHAIARPFDAAGLLRLAAAGLIGPGGVDGDHPDVAGQPGADAAAARSDVLLGLAADALGQGRTAEARRLFGIESASVNAGWRAEVRRGWVAAEIELGAGMVDAAVAPAEAAAAAAAGSGSTRHQVKSGLVLGVALAAVGERPRARDLIFGAHADATRLGLWPLVWPCALVLADIDPDDADAHRRNAARALHGVLRHSDPVARAAAAASPWVPTWQF
ncbi:MAG TPA: hypothetical protein VM677_15495 [Actinokineospora sp.]|nr:hypothetical protein [Actinokineospora sp.]